MQLLQKIVQQIIPTGPLHENKAINSSIVTGAAGIGKHEQVAKENE
jgi:hypothetical protein